MGLTYATIQLSNARNEQIAPVNKTALVDTGALMLCIPPAIVAELELEELEKRLVTLADSKSQWVPYVGPIKVSFGNRFCFVGALVLGTEVLLGAIPMEEMDVMVHPATQKLINNPLHPKVPNYIVK